MKKLNLSEWALRHQALVLYFMVMLMVSGLWAYTQLGQKEDPEFTFKAMLVQTYWPGAKAVEVEQQISDRLEEKLQEMPEIKYVQSYSKPGESLLLITLREDVPAKNVQSLWYQVRKNWAMYAAACPLPRKGHSSTMSLAIPSATSTPLPVMASRRKNCAVTWTRPRRKSCGCRMSPRSA
jgi:multidrug efflux pump